MDKPMLTMKLEHAFTTPLKTKDQNLVLCGTAETVWFKKESDVTKDDDIIVILPTSKIRSGLDENGWNALISLCKFYYTGRGLWKGI